jgi:uncharacterized membrane protein
VTRRVQDVVIVAALSALATAAVLLFPSVPVIKLAAAGPLVLVLPGYALTMALLPGLRGAPERLALTLGLTFAVDIAVGLLLQFFPGGLNATSWALALCGVTVLACLAAVGRRSAQVGADAERQVARGATSLRLSGRQALVGGAALVVALVAMWVALLPVPEQPDQGYTLLWAVPSEGAPNSFVLGVRSMEPASSGFTLRLVADGQTLEQFPIVLAPAETWQAQVELPTGGPSINTVQALLYRADKPDAEYRSVDLRVGSLARP